MAMQKATAVLGAPGSDAERVKKMMATRPGLNANRRRAPRQDLSGATPQGTITGRGNKTQQLGVAAMRRMQPQPAPAAEGGDGFTTSMVSGQPAYTTMGDGPPPGSVTPEMIAQMKGGPAVPQIGDGPPVGVSRSVDAPMGMEGALPGAINSLEQAVGRQAQPLGGGAGGLTPEQTASMSRPLGGGQVPPEMAGAVQTALAGAKGGGGFSPGLPPQIMQRLQALRGGGLQGGAGAGAGGAPTRSFADFWGGGGGGQMRGAAF